jgi:hypothetical protein
LIFAFYSFKFQFLDDVHVDFLFLELGLMFIAGGFCVLDEDWVGFGLELVAKGTVAFGDHIGAAACDEQRWVFWGLVAETR